MNHKDDEKISLIREMIIKHLPTNYMATGDVATNIYKEENCTERGISKNHIILAMGIMHGENDPNIDVETVSTPTTYYYIIRRKKKDETPQPTNPDN